MCACVVPVCLCASVLFLSLCVYSTLEQCSDYLCFSLAIAGFLCQQQLVPHINNLISYSFLILIDSRCLQMFMVGCLVKELFFVVLIDRITHEEGRCRC